jgi:hypothetical protein
MQGDLYQRVNVAEMAKSNWLHLRFAGGGGQEATEDNSVKSIFWKSIVPYPFKE